MSPASNWTIGDELNGPATFLWLDHDGPILSQLFPSPLAVIGHRLPLLQLANRTKTGHAAARLHGRPWPISDPGAKYFRQNDSWKEISNKTGKTTKTETGLMKNDVLWKSAPTADSHSTWKSLANIARLYPIFHRPGGSFTFNAKRKGNGTAGPENFS